MGRAKKDLASAGIIKHSDLEAAYQLLYDGMLHSALAYITGDGFQPDIRGKHKTLIDYTAHTLGSVDFSIPSVILSRAKDLL